MKQYKYKINGNLYNVTVNDVEDNIARVEVNGTPYNVELDKPLKVAPKPIVRPAAAPKTCRFTSGRSCQEQRREVSAARCYPRHQSERRRYGEERTGNRYPGSHEDGKQHQCRQRRKSYCNQS